MSKKKSYTVKFKLHCVKKVLEEHRSIVSVSNEMGVPTTPLSYWCRIYAKKGKKGLEPRPPRKYSPAFKLKVLTYIKEKDISLLDACILFDISGEVNIIRWRRA